MDKLEQPQTNRKSTFFRIKFKVNIYFVRERFGLYKLLISIL